MSTTDTLTPSQLDALRQWRDEHGDENWKRKLTLAWVRASAPAPLHALRNSHGPSWLHSFTLPTDMTNTKRYALIQGDADLRDVQDFLPSNYTATSTEDGILISGHDRFGWTLDGYVLPRLGSALIAGKEVFL